MNRKYVVIIGLFIILPCSLFAWGQLGHRVIGELAQTQLTKKANKKITALLKGSTLAMEANWADYIKSDTLYKTYSDWHYTNVEAGVVSRSVFDSVVMNPANGQLIPRILDVIDELKKNANDTVKLKLLIHLVGDLHCPMHLARPADKGGNKITVTFLGRGVNLHNLWDDQLIETQKLSYKEYAAHLLRTQPMEQGSFSRTLILDCAWNSYCVSEQIYANIDMVSESYNYIYVYKPIMEHMLVTGGEHLAVILNYIYAN